MTRLASFADFFGETTLYRDWDYFASTAHSLRLYLTQYHTVPTWNLMLCGGRPELASPQSWAFTWPSLLIYLLPGNAGITVLWILMSLVGFFAMNHLLRQLGAGAPPALMGSLLYVANGFFATRFNQGHATYAFFHLIPLLMVCALHSWDSLASGGKRLRPLITIIGVTYLFVTAALPHALFYFYPAFPLFLLGLAWRRHWNMNFVRRVKALLLLVTSHLLGAALAAHELWPVVAWQVHNPRRGVLLEDLDLVDMIANTVRFIPDYHQVFHFFFDRQVWFAWEYNAYVGEALWVVIAFGTLLWLANRKSGSAAVSGAPDPLMPLFGLLCSMLGIALALGNGDTKSLTQFFTYFPLLSGIRVFARFQILLIFGLCMIGTWASYYVLEPLGHGRLRSARRILTYLMVFFVCAAPLQQVWALISTVESLDDESSRVLYPLVREGNVPQLVAPAFVVEEGMTHQDFLLRRGFWITNCYEPMTLNRTQVREKVMPLTDPPPERIVNVGGDSITLAYNEQVKGSVAVNLISEEQFEYNVLTTKASDGRRTFLAEDLPNHQFIMHRPPLAATRGFYLSIGGLVLTLVFLWWVRRRDLGREA